VVQKDADGTSSFHQRQLKSRYVGIILVLADFLLPAYFGLHLGRLYLSNWFWYIQVIPVFSFEVYPIEALILLPLLYANCIRLLFAYQMMRLYEGRTSGKRVYLMALLAISLELLMFSGNMLSYVLIPNYHYAFTTIPTPLLPLSAFLLVLIFPPETGRISWIEMQPIGKWWKPTGQEQEW